jgi:hypothetical protein
VSADNHRCRIPSNYINSDNQKILLEKALSVVERIPSAVTTGANNSDENAWKNCWNWNLTDAAYGQLILDIKEGRVNAELKSQGFNYAYRRQAAPAPIPAVGGTSTPAPQEPSGSGNPTGPAKLASLNPPSKVGTPTPPSKAPSPAPPPAISAHASVPQQVLNPVLPSAPTPKPATPAPSEPTASAPQANGSGDKELSKKEKRKQKEKEKKESVKAANSNANAPGNGSGRATPADKGGEQQKRSNGLAPPSSVAADGPVPDPTSPVAETASGGSQTPIGRKGSRNPWTLFVKHLPVPVAEEEIREFFGEAAAGVSTKLNFAGRGITEICFGRLYMSRSLSWGLGRRSDTLRMSSLEMRRP